MTPELLTLPDHIRRGGIYFPATKGAGKSRTLGRGLAWRDFRRGVPLMILDPHGEVIRNFLCKVSRMPAWLQRHALRRIVYIDTAGLGAGENRRVAPFPLLYRLGQESLETIAQRHLEVLKRFDPQLVNAPILGWNALSRVGRDAGIILAALGLQLIPEAEDLLRHPERWAGRIEQAARAYPKEVAGAARFFLNEYITARQREREMLSGTYLTKLGLFSRDPAMVAQFGADAPILRFDEAVRRRQAVLVNFGNEPSEERRRFKLLWLYHYLLEFVKRRSSNRGLPLAVYIDEITFILGNPTDPNDPLAQDLEALANLYSRNNNIWLCLAQQEPYQVSERMRKTLMSLGTQIIGQISDDETALLLARRFDRYDPRRVKQTEPIYSSYQGQDYIIDYRDTIFSPQEQDRLNARRYKELSTLHFLLGIAPREGTVATELHEIDLSCLDPGEYPVTRVIAKAQGYLMRRDAPAIGDLLEAIAARQEHRSEARTAELSASPGGTPRLSEPL